MKLSIAAALLFASLASAQVPQVTRIGAFELTFVVYSAAPCAGCAGLQGIWVSIHQVTPANVNALRIKGDALLEDGRAVTFDRAIVIEGRDTGKLLFTSGAVKPAGVRHVSATQYQADQPAEIWFY